MPMWYVRRFFEMEWLGNTFVLFRRETLGYKLTCSDVCLMQILFLILQLSDTYTIMSEEQSLADTFYGKVKKNNWLVYVFAFMLCA